jgi:hypothetical protein
VTLISCLVPTSNRTSSKHNLIRSGVVSFCSSCGGCQRSEISKLAHVNSCSVNGYACPPMSSPNQLRTVTEKNDAVNTLSVLTVYIRDTNYFLTTRNTPICYHLTQPSIVLCSHSRILAGWLGRYTRKKPRMQ